MLAPATPVRFPSHARGIIIAGELGRSSGLGEGARLLVRSIREAGIPCATWDIDRKCLEGDQVGQSAPLLIHVNAPLLPYVQLFMPRRLLRNRRIIGYWAWELPVLPKIWLHANRHVHEIWTPSHFTADALRTFRKTVRVVPYPFSAADQKPSSRDRASFGLPSQAVIVLVSFNLASSMIRKNPLDTIHAFKEAFGNRSDRVLLLKIGHTENYLKDLSLIREAVGNASNIRIETGDFSGPDTLALMKCSDIVLSLHRSEGFGLVVAEAMALGRCVIATDWSATAEFMDETCGFPIPYTLVPAEDPRGVLDIPRTRWALPDISAASAALRRAADDPALRSRLGDAARERVFRKLNSEPLQTALETIGVEA
ncbi:glycosyltransferase family 4 protein [Gluconobacter morbifer]|uniref:Mannosyltransferase n=1 Tax=Gluconobacter morbifer G707 TaxID=1088869 RepID=G6XHW8_9PROT|nr:glycosyltransferase family 4 protein [Gluconobacter morbifer]EHH68342.1 mannosyltransferase [Gluconobacter morbifer G707]